MKKLISAQTIEQEHNAGNFKIEVSAEDMIVTDEAFALAKQLGVELIYSKGQQSVSYTDMQKIVTEVLHKFPGGKFSRARIEKAVKEVLALRKT